MKTKAKFIVAEEKEVLDCELLKKAIFYYDAVEASRLFTILADPSLNEMQEEYRNALKKIRDIIDAFKEYDMIPTKIVRETKKELITFQSLEEMKETLYNNAFPYEIEFEDNASEEIIFIHVKFLHDYYDYEETKLDKNSKTYEFLFIKNEVTPIKEIDLVPDFIRNEFVNFMRTKTKQLI